MTNPDDEAALAAAEALARERHWWSAKPGEPHLAMRCLEAVAIARRLQAENVALTERLRVAEFRRDVWAEQATSNESRLDRANLALTERLRVAEAGPCARCKGCVCGHLAGDATPSEPITVGPDHDPRTAKGLGDVFILAKPKSHDAAPKEAT